MSCCQLATLGRKGLAIKYTISSMPDNRRELDCSQQRVNKEIGNVMYLKATSIKTMKARKASRIRNLL